MSCLPYLVDGQGNHLLAIEFGMLIRNRESKTVIAYYLWCCGVTLLRMPTAVKLKVDDTLSPVRFVSAVLTCALYEVSSTRLSFQRLESHATASHSKLPITLHTLVFVCVSYEEEDGIIAYFIHSLIASIALYCCFRAIPRPFRLGPVSSRGMQALKDWLQAFLFHL